MHETHEKRTHSFKHMPVKEEWAGGSRTVINSLQQKLRRWRTRRERDEADVLHLRRQVTQASLTKLVYIEA